MATEIAGKYYAKSITTASANEDVIATLRTAANDTSLTNVKKLFLSTTANATISINGGPVCDLYLNADSRRELLLDGRDVYVNSLTVSANNATVFVSVIY